jgi:pilus assembly protein Flp/PilA
MARLWKRLVRDESGATAIEYGLIVALVFLTAVSAINLFADNMTAMFGKISTAIMGSG